MAAHSKPTLLAVLADAEQSALEHVGHLRARGVPLAEAAEAIGLDAANVHSWDAVTQAYAGKAYAMSCRDLFNQCGAAADAERGVPL